MKRIASAVLSVAAATPGVFSSVEFVPFGVQLQIRPLVGENDTITLDVQPLVVTPDAVLTDTIRQSTGAAVATTAFQTLYSERERRRRATEAPPSKPAGGERKRPRLLESCHAFRTDGPVVKETWPDYYTGT